MTIEFRLGITDTDGIAYEQRKLYYCSKCDSAKVTTLIGGCIKCGTKLEEVKGR